VFIAFFVEFIQSVIPYISASLERRDVRLLTCAFRYVSS